MQTPDIAELILRIRQGDREARRELLSLLADEERLGAVLLGMARKMLPPTHPARRLVDSHDVVQSTLRTALDQFPTFRGDTEGKLYGWLATIIRTKVSRAVRKLHKAYPVESPEGSPKESPDPLEELVVRGMIEKLHEAIQRLPLGQRLVVELRLRQLSSADSARILGLNAATVRKREQRAIGNLKRLLEEREPPPQV